MGNLCGQERTETSSITPNKLRLFKTINRTCVNIHQGDILIETTTALLNAQEDPYDTPLMKSFTQSFRQHLNPGEPIMIPYHQNGIQFIINLKIPINFEDDSNDFQIQSFIDAFELASSKNIECLSFAEPLHQLSNQKPKNYYAKLFFQALHFFSYQESHAKIRLIKCVIEKPFIDIYINELENISILTSDNNNIQIEQSEQQSQKKESTVFKNSTILKQYNKLNELLNTNNEQQLEQQIILDQQNEDKQQQQDQQIVEQQYQKQNEQNNNINEVQVEKQNPNTLNNLINENTIEEKTILQSLDINEYIREYSNATISEILLNAIDKLSYNKQ